MALSREERRSLGRATASDRIALFGVLWAIAALLHLLAVGPDAPAWVQAALALGAGLALSWPGAVLPLTVLAGAGVATAWSEAPDLAEHWLLVALVDVAILVSVAVGALRRRFADRVDLAERLFPTARLCLLGAYAFAAFAKLNDGFLDRRVSCAVVRFRDATSSLGLESLQLDGTAWLERAVILGVLAVSAAVPVLLLLRRVRWIGVVLALGIHVLVGLDRSEPFFDASAAMVALLSLFLPAAGPWAAERFGSVRARLALRGPRLPLWLRLALVLGPTALGLAVAADRLAPETGRDVGWWAWQGCAVVAVVAVARLLGQARSSYPVRMLPHHALYALVPLLVALNGLAPYLEVKTGAAWTTYANLRTVDGETNHLLVPGTLSLSGHQADVVRIVDTDDPTLARHRSRAVGLTWRDLRSYLHDHPQVSVAYVREGRRVALTRASDRPELVEAVPVWQEKLLPFRPVDLIAPERCIRLPSP
jgi:hypothetical protein